LVTQQRQHLFGDIQNGAMVLSTLGQIVRDEWMHSIQIRGEIRLFEDEFVVMPNHHHAIVWIIDSNVGADAVRPDHPKSNKITTMNADRQDNFLPKDLVGAAQWKRAHAMRPNTRPNTRPNGITNG